MIAQAQESVLISGATTGIGLACAQLLAQARYQVFAGYRKPDDALRLQALSTNIIPILLDMTQPDTIQNALKTLEANLEKTGLAALINNAGIAIGGPLEFVSPEQMREQLEVNLLGHMQVTQSLLPLLRQAKGRIINMSSISGLMAMPFLGPYCISKFAMEAWSDSLWQELRPWGIEVVVLEPGSINTPIWKKSQKVDTNGPCQKLYGPALAAIESATKSAEERSIPAETVAQAVLKVLMAKRPKTRCLVGKDAQKYRWLRLLPDRLRDALIAWKVGLP